VSLVNTMGNSLLSIETQVNEINDSIAAIVSSAKEQSLGLSEVNNAIRQMDQATQQNAAMVEETNAACQELQSQSNQLKAALGRFRFDGSAPAEMLRTVAAQMSSQPAQRPVVVQAARPQAAAPRTAVRVAVTAQSTAAVAQNWEEF
jgi:methyl-accepting chemotaxis protein